ncbi:hypothetical protein L1987_84424 [Smallanthus sonchifolius]|uniref:Uncharacterized protein n=1 Tax=Smallanthus sonchifolius TaxID=185202 RepID=A0ACB8YFA1_9ASTR|nr:hypothetical protein L1987_84424 [Smallanthus sonchifolius]
MRTMVRRMTMVNTLGMMIMKILGMVMGLEITNMKMARGANLENITRGKALERKKRQPVAPMGGVNGRVRPAILENASPIVPPIPGMRRFKSRPNYINVLPHFHGMVTEEPYTHLAEFTAICSTIGDENFDQSEVKPRLFLFSLKDRAKQWFVTLPANSIHTWEEMQQVFLDEYYSVTKTDDSRIEIRTFQQQTGKPLHEAFTRFKELWELVKCFMNGLTQEERKYLKSTSNGTLLSNPEEDDWDFLERMSQSSKAEALASRRAKHTISKKGEKKEVAGVKVRFDVCEDCGDLGHKTIECPFQEGRQEEVNQVYGERKQYDMNSNNYHPGLRNHPNFKYGNAANQMNPNFQGVNQNTSSTSYQPRQQGNYNSGSYQRGSYNNNRNTNYPPRNYNQDHQQQNGSSGGDDAVSSKLDALLEMMKESKKENEVRDKSFVALERQVGQMAEEISMLKQGGGTLNPQHQGSSSTNANVNKVTVLRNGKVIDNKVESPPQLVEGVVEDVIEDEESEGEVEFVNDKKPITQNPEKIKPVLRDESPIAKGKDMTGDFVPYPEALVEPFKAKMVNKRGPQQEEMWEMFRQVKINIPLLDAIKQIPAYAKYLKELCTQKRNHKFPKKLDVTANVNAILSGALPPKLQDPGAPIISIQVEDFYFPVDFLVLDYVSSDRTKQPTVILGRPFLATANAQINCRSGTVDMTFGNRKLRLNVFSHISNSLVNDECFMADIFDRYIPLCDVIVNEDGTTETCFSCDRLQVETSRELEEEEKRLEAMAIKNGRPPWTHQVESLPEHIDKNLKPSLEQPPKVELKKLPKNLKYAFVGEDDTLPVIIASNLTKEQEEAVMKVLAAHKVAIGWSIADLKGISPSIVMHKIVTDQVIAPSHDAQRRLNPNMREVVKKEVLKWLDAGIVYPISDSTWVSPTQTVPKKAGIQVVKNDSGEEVATRAGNRVADLYRLQEIKCSYFKRSFPITVH